MRADPVGRWGLGRNSLFGQSFSLDQRICYAFSSLVLTIVHVDLSRVLKWLQTKSAGLRFVLERALELQQTMKQFKRYTWHFFGLSAVAWVLDFLWVHFVFRSLGVTVSLGLIAGVLCVVALVSFVTPTPGGIGLAEVPGFYLYLLFGVPKTAIASIYVLGKVIGLFLPWLITLGFVLIESPVIRSKIRLAWSVMKPNVAIGETEAFYRELDEIYRDPGHLMSNKLDIIVPRIRGGERLLDAGCGTGEAVIRLQDRFRSVIAVDSNSNAVEFARRKTLSFPNVSVTKGDLRNLGFASSSFDCCLMLDVLEHLAEPKLALLEAHRCLSEAGQLVISVPNWFDIFTSGLLKRNPRHKTAHTPGGWRRLLEDSGFQVLHCRAVRFPFIKSKVLAEKMPYVGML